MGSGFGSVGGFTLIEVVAVLITGLTLAVLLPGVTSTVSEQATLDYCLSNLRELGMATSSYASDYDDYLPTYGISFTGMVGIYQGTSFIDRLEPYINSSNPWRCPLDEVYYGREPLDHTSYMLGATKTVYLLMSSPYGQWLPYKTTDYPCESKSNIYTTPEYYDLREPSREGLYCDMNYLIGENRVHNGGYNVVFIDGHVKWYLEVEPDDPDYFYNKRMGTRDWETGPVCGDANHPYPAGDLTYNCRTDWTDFSVLASQWVKTNCNETGWCGGADMNHSTTVDWSDFSIFADDWLACTAPQCD